MKKLMVLCLLGACLWSCSQRGGSDTIPLRVWVGDHADVPWMEQVIREFQAANPDKRYNIQIGIQNEGDAAKVILADMEAAADVFTFADDQFSALHNAGALMPVEEGAENIRQANTAGSVAAATATDGQLYAYPATADNGYFLFYNRAVISANAAASFEQLLDAAASAGKKVAYPLSNGWYLYGFFRGAGLEMSLSDDGVTNRCNWNARDTDIPGVDVLSAIMGLAAHPGFVEADSDAFVAGIKDGSIVAGVSGTWNAAVASQVWGENYAAAKLPTFRAGEQAVQMASFAGYKLVGVNAYSAQVGDAMDLAAFMTAGDAQADRFVLRRQGPSNLQALSDPAVRAEPAIAALEAQAPFADIQRVGSRYWDAAASLGKIIAAGNPEDVPLQTLLDNCVAAITAPADQ